MAKKVNTARLGTTQKDWLMTTHEHRDSWKDQWYAGCGRVWTSEHQTIKLCEGLVQRGLMYAAATKTVRGVRRIVYKLTKGGIKVAEEWRAETNRRYEEQREMREREQRNTD